MSQNVLSTNLSGKVAVVTGAGGVLCGALAKALARAGAKVALLNRSMEKAEKYTEEILAESGTAKAYPCNVLDKSACLAVAEEEEILPALLRLTVYRQPQTLFHTVIVARSAKLVMREIIRQRPEYLLGVLSCHNTEDVKKKEKELTDFIEIGALLHDVGKILCTNVINMQYRRLNNLEFQVIKYHPVTSRHILQQVSYLQQYADIAAGHHKTYDGLYGYPHEFDYYRTPNKIFIDLVRICDSFDAATDYLGRSYAKNKTFEQVLKELQMGSGACYSKEMTDLIVKSPSLQQELEKLLLHDRETICLDMYTKMKELLQE